MLTNREKQTAMQAQYFGRSDWGIINDEGKIIL